MTRVSAGALVVKRLLDVSTALVLLSVLSPFLVSVGVVIRLLDGAPVLYRGTRVGRHGELFTIYKFRTMKGSADSGSLTTAPNDHRVSALGEVLRRWKIDELPQLVNVLRGDMSLVGPRPEIRGYVDLYGSEERRALSMRPGLTDPASVKYRSLQKHLDGDPHFSYLERVFPDKNRLRVQYVDEWSLSGDIRILCQTFRSVVRQG